MTDLVFGPPDWVGVGSHKAGTTWWNDLICQHPRAIPAMIEGYSYTDGGWVGKQLQYLDRYHHDHFDLERARREYWSHFGRPEGMLCGEWTPRYAANWWSIPLLAKLAPNTKILMTLRDPVVRYESNIAHYLKHKVRDNELPVESDERGPLAAVWSEECWWWGLYVPQVRRVLEHFPRDQILFLQYEKMAENPTAEFRKTLDFLGLERFDPPEIHQRLNASGAHEGAFVLDDRQREHLALSYRDDIRDLKHILPDLDVSVWTHHR